MEIENTLQGYELLWRELEKARLQLALQSRRFCLKNIFRMWFPSADCNNLEDSCVGGGGWIFRICRMLDDHQIRLDESHDFIGGWTELPPPATHPRVHRFILQSLVMVALGIGRNQVNTQALDEAYSHVFPFSTPLCVSKKGRVSKVAT